MAEDVADPTLHTTLPVDDAVSVTVIPGHKVALDAVIDGVGENPVTKVTVFALVAVPQALVIVAVTGSGKVVVMVDVVAPVLQVKDPALPIVVNVADWPLHNKVDVGTIVNAGVALTLTVAVCTDDPQIFAEVTV